MTQATRACAHCGQQHQRRGAKYCTPLCGSRAYNARRSADGRLSQYNNDPDVKARFLAWKQENYDRYRYDRTCVVCGKTWRTQHKDGKYCNIQCYAQDKRKPMALPAPAHVAKRAAAQRRLARAARGTAGTKWAAGPCRRCGTTFVCAITGHASLYCSKRCYRGDHKDRRRAAERRAFVEHVARIAVFERDGWTCHLCKQPVDRSKPAPHPLSPTIDHVVALANGGEHSMANARTAHFLCNSIKGARV